MTLLSMTPTAQTKTASAGDLSALLTAGTLGSNTGVTFTNTGREVLFVQQSATASTIVVAIGSTVEGQAVSSITLAGVNSHIQFVGPFNSDENQPGGTITVTFGVPANVTGVALLQNAGAF